MSIDCTIYGRSPLRVARPRSPLRPRFAVAKLEQYATAPQRFALRSLTNRCLCAVQRRSGSKNPTNGKSVGLVFAMPPLHCPPWPAAFFVRRSNALNVVYGVHKLNRPAAIKFRSETKAASMPLWPRPRPPCSA